MPPEQNNPPQQPGIHGVTQAPLAAAPAAPAPPPTGLAGPTLPAAQPAQPKEPPPPKYKGGFLTEYGMHEVLRAGGSVSWNGRIINHPSQVPTQADMDKENSRQTALQQQWAQAQQGGAFVPPPPQIAQPGTQPPARK